MNIDSRSSAKAGAPPGAEHQPLASLVRCSTNCKPQRFQQDAARRTSPWRASSPQKSRMTSYNDISQGRSFPTFTALPEIEFNGSDERYYTRSGTGLTPCLNWVLFGEVTSVERFTRLVINIKDRDDTAITVAFYLDDDHDDLNMIQASDLCKKGRTVALLYPNAHLFVDGRSGVRLEKFETFKVFNCTLKELYSANAAVKLLSATPSDRHCHACNAERADLACAGCQMFGYCSRECQIVGWTDKGHKSVCKVLKDPDARRLFKLNWSNFGPQKLSFPLA